MQYNIDFEIASIPFVLILILFHYIKYNSNTLVNRRFRVLAFLSLATIVLDSLVNVTCSYYTVVPLSVNILLNTVNFMTVSYSCYYFTVYIQTVISEDYKPFFQIKSCFSWMSWVSFLIFGVDFIFILMTNRATNTALSIRFIL